jgi:transcriptional regulator with PAS, ATPase and Fis domain
MRVGGTRVIRTDARILAATGKELKGAVDDGSFREDLYYRLSVIPVRLPALRERVGDIELLIRHFMAQFGQQMDASCRRFSDAALDALCAYRWPGNVRELRNIVERMLVLHGRSEEITVAMLPDEFHAGGRRASLSLPTSLESSVLSQERTLIEAALQQSEGNQTRAAVLLRTTRRKLKYRMDKLGIS